MALIIIIRSFLFSPRAANSFHLSRVHWFESTLRCRFELITMGISHLFEKASSQPGRAIAADKRMRTRLSMPIKLAFWATNLFYWAVFVTAVVRLASERVAFGGVGSVCSVPAFQVAVIFMVACASTAMHTSQLQLGGVLCGCMCHKRHVDKFHSPTILKKFKALDVSCAFSSLVLLGACRGMGPISKFFVYAFPVFLGGLFSKRFNYHYIYVALHGTWHFLTAYLAYSSFAEMS